MAWPFTERIYFSYRCSSSACRKTPCQRTENAFVFSKVSLRNPEFTGFQSAPNTELACAGLGSARREKASR